MNFNQRVSWIQRSIAKATIKRQALLDSLPVLRQKIKDVQAALDAAEAVFLKMENCCTDEWNLLTDEVEQIVIDLSGELDRAELNLDDVKARIEDIEHYMECAAYDADDSAKA